MTLDNAASDWLNHSLELMTRFQAQAPLVQAIGQKTAQVLARKGLVLACGNGGSASQADHLVCELVARFQTERRPLPAISLSSTPAGMTSLANDYGYDEVFARQVEAFGEDGDVLFALTTSGNSPNVLRAAERARDRGLFVVGLTGKGGGSLPPLCDLCLTIESDNTARVQEMHQVAIHAICDIVDKAFAANTDATRA